MKELKEVDKASLGDKDLNDENLPSDDKLENDFILEVLVDETSVTDVIYTNILTGDPITDRVD